MKHIIWDNDVCNMYDCVKNNLEDVFPDTKEEDITDDMIWDAAYEEIEVNLDAEICNLDIDLDKEIVLIGDIVRWDGSHSAHTELKTNNIGKAMEEAVTKWDGDNTFEIYVEDGRMFISQTGHDNPCSPSVFEFRMLKPDYDEWEDEISLENTESIGNKVSKVYGWEAA